MQKVQKITKNIFKTSLIHVASNFFKWSPLVCCRQPNSHISFPFFLFFIWYQKWSNTDFSSFPVNECPIHYLTGERVLYLFIVYLFFSIRRAQCNDNLLTILANLSRETVSIRLGQILSVHINYPVKSGLYIWLLINLFQRPIQVRHLCQLTCQVNNTFLSPLVLCQCRTITKPGMWNASKFVRMVSCLSLSFFLFFYNHFLFVIINLGKSDMYLCLMDSQQHQGQDITTRFFNFI